MTIDIDRIRKKYRDERNKRIRPDGFDQYIRIEGEFANFDVDPHIEKKRRGAVKSHHEVVILGGGFGGVLTGVKLKDAGIDDFLIIEKGGDFGGTWYWNRYPGLACDMKSYIYLPLLEETGYMPPRNYASGEEIRGHVYRIIDHWGLREKGLLHTEAHTFTWQESESHWLIETDHGDEITANRIILQPGPISEAKLPGIEGILDFKGKMFHAARWDYDYTGGSMSEHIGGLSDKRVAIIGTGATGVQVIPRVAESAKQLFVVQRTPSVVDERGEETTDPEWVASLKPGWHREMMDCFNILTYAGEVEEDLVKDGWTDLAGRLAGMMSKSSGDDITMDQIPLTAEMADAEKMEEIRTRMEAIVKDQKVAEKLKPYYRFFCKRPTFHDGYLEAFNRDNVTLIDTGGRGLDKITESGFEHDGVEYEVDCIIFASGYQPFNDYSRRVRFDVVGKDGITLNEKWADGIESFHSMHVHGFPNMLIQNFSQGAASANFCHAAIEGAEHFTYILRHCLDENIKVFEASAESQKEWVATCVGFAGFNAHFLAECTPGINNSEGKLNPHTAKNGPYGGGPAAFYQVLKEWRKNDDYQGLEFTPASD